MTVYFQTREEAGRRLAQALRAFELPENTLVLALPRGGVPVAHEISKALHLPLDALLVRKLGVPGHAELAMGAIAWGGIRVLNEDIVRQFHIPPAVIDAASAKEERELQRRNKRYRNDRLPTAINGRHMIVVDDGLATGATMKAAVETLRKAGAAHIIVAVPVGAALVCDALKRKVDEVVCLLMPQPFYGVSQAYADFSPTSERQVQTILAYALPENAGGRAPTKNCDGALPFDV